MSLIDEELESFSNEDIQTMIDVVNEGINSNIRLLKQLESLSIQELLDQDPEFAEIYKGITHMLPYNTEEITQRVINKHVGKARTNMMKMQNVITKLHLLKSRL